MAGPLVWNGLPSDVTTGHVLNQLMKPIFQLKRFETFLVSKSNDFDDGLILKFPYDNEASLHSLHLPSKTLEDIFSDSHLLNSTCIMEPELEASAYGRLNLSLIFFLNLGRYISEE